jgi:hypothetical protein
MKREIYEETQAEINKRLREREQDENNVNADTIQLCPTENPLSLNLSNG